MGSGNIPYYVVLDANVWVAERLLQSSMGGAILFALTSSGASLGLPKIVEMEVNSVLTADAERAVEGLRKSARFLRQLSGQKTLHQAPTREAIQEGLRERWTQLSGLLERTPFTFDQAKSALKRVIEKRPPSGENNEQFRDTCLWEAAIDLSTRCTVHLVTNDSAFYEGRDRTRGLAKSLCEELAGFGRNIVIYASVREFLSRIDKAVASLDESTIAKAIVEAITPDARQMAADKASLYELASVTNTRIRGYATPKPSLVAISFEVTFSLSRIDAKDSAESESGSNLRLEGVCSYDHKRKDVSDIEIRGWWTWTKEGGGGSMSTGTFPSKALYID